MKSTEQLSYLEVNIGKIAVFQRQHDSPGIPLICLHGVYFDHHLWDQAIDSIKDRRIITMDMPLHGQSRDISKEDWNLQDCAEMLIDVLNKSGISRAIAVGHSWGSMTILKAAHQHPDRFAAIGLCNMPFLPATALQKVTFGLQHAMLAFRNFYTKEAAKALFGRSSLKENPLLVEELRRPMDMLSGRNIRLIDKRVILDAEDASALTGQLKVSAIALRGEEDYVPTPPGIETILVRGGHISPLEDVMGVRKMIDGILSKY